MKFAGLVALLLVQAELAAQPTLESGSVMEAAERLKAGEFIWAPDVAPEGPVLLVISLPAQRAILYRNGVPVGISTVSTGRRGHRTPTGVFTVLQRHVEHYSSLYNNAPMPYMQRLTWGGVALHGGHLPGYPASHGCIRLPHEFARLLYGVTRLGMTVIVTDQAAVPRVAPVDVLLARSGEPADPGLTVWTPEASPTGPVSVVISAADRRLVVLRNGRIIGRAPVAIDGPIGRTTAYMLRRIDGERREWLRLALPGQSDAPADGTELRGRIRLSEPFRTTLASILHPGATVVVTADSLRSAEAGRSVTVVEGGREGDPPAR